MMRQALAVLALLLCSITSSLAQFSVNIGINLPVYPQLVRVPGYPVYYAPGVNSNYFFYDGMYWVYADDNWYASTWYNGPWEVVAPDYVPLYVLRVPVRYYRRAPAYFRSWRADAPPRWGDHWGNTWYDNHRDWDRWNRRSVPAPAPLPVYQRQYSGDRYPRGEQQVTLQTRNYRYEPRDATVQRQYQAQRAQLPAATQTPASAAPAQERSRPTSSPVTQQHQQQMQRQAARPPSSAQSGQPRDVQQQVARPPGTPSAETSAPGSPQMRQRRDAQQAARPPGTPSAETTAPRSPQARQQRDAQQAARPPSGPQGRPPQAEQRAATPPQAGNAAAQPPRAPQAAAPRGEPTRAQGGEPPARGKSGESRGNGRGPQDKQDKQDKKPD